MVNASFGLVSSVVSESCTQCRGRNAQSRLSKRQANAISSDNSHAVKQLIKKEGGKDRVASAGYRGLEEGEMRKKDKDKDAYVSFEACLGWDRLWTGYT